MASSGAHNTEAESPTSANPHPSSLTTLPDPRQQSFEEIYGPPENILEIEVSGFKPRPGFQTRTCGASKPHKR